DRMQSAVVRMRVADQAGGASAAEPKSPETRLAEARLMILNGRYDEGTAALKALAQDQFGEAKYSYYYAAALLRQGLLTPTYQKQEALGALRHAQALARGPERAAVIAQAIEEADKVKPPAAQRAADLAE
ncbi:MAG: hypothetical protein NTW86_30735, partial [Candidatus Sumerlaeota bacterium]|nr:hypothetical protein [Candidatus Sumerlaeota bacterium]